MSVPTLKISDLTVSYGDGQMAVRDAYMEIQPGQAHGLVGESGSGKTTLALAVMRYLSREGRIVSGSIELEGTDLASVDMQEYWGSRLALVPQDPQSALNPSLRVGEQLAEPLSLHLRQRPGQIEAEIHRLLDRVHMPDVDRVLASYPHELSGGMQQRVLIAMALSTDPSLIILDEPTTGLDATTEAAILDLLRELLRGGDRSALYVSHNLGVVAQVADRVSVLYASELVEEGPTQDLFLKPLHPYTQGLLDSVPRLGESKRQIRLRAIQGQIPELTDLPPACVFAPRCPIAIDICHEVRPELERSASERRVRCHRWQEIDAGEVDPRQPTTMGVAESELAVEPLIRLDEVKISYPLRRTIPQLLTLRPASRVKALNGVTLQILRGETLGLVGESGSGKTTLAKAIVGLTSGRSGEIELLGAELPVRLKDRSLDHLKQLQLVFQNPAQALNPHRTVLQALERPLLTLHGMVREKARRQVFELLRAVRLPEDFALRYPAQLSGGEKQRVAIARAFAATPGLLITDEPVSSLDVSVQAAILDLLNQLQSQHGAALLFISHDIAVVGYLADRVAVLYLGSLMEVADSQALFAPPYHPYTEALLSAVPLIDPNAIQQRSRLSGEIPSALEIPTGCPFHTRCPRYLGDICREEPPPWKLDSVTGKHIYCHITPTELRSIQRPAFEMLKRAD